jgi:hypothetical protein
MADSLLHVLYVQDSLLLSIQAIPLQAFSDSALSFTQQVQTNWNKEVDVEAAKNLSRLVLTGKSAERLLAVSNNLEVESARLKKQVVLLKEALDNGATHDAAGHELTSEYVASCLFEEQKAIDTFCASREHTRIVADDIVEKFQSQSTLFQEWRNSWTAQKAVHTTRP